jgi:hypothetical protein
MFYPESLDKAFRRTDRCFAVPADTLVDRDCNQAYVFLGTQEAVKDEEEGGAVLAAAQGNRNAVARHDLLLRSDGFSNPFFDVGDEVGTAEVPPGMPLVENCRFPAEVAGRPCPAKRFRTHVSAPVGDPDNPELVIPAGKGIFRDQLPVPYNHHFKGVEALSLQDRFNGSRGGIDHPGAPVRQDQVHEMISTFAGRFLNA